MTVNITSKKGELFVIDSAKVELYVLKNNVLVHESTPGCTIEGTKINSIIQPQQKGDYIIKITLEIADEVIIKKFNMVVEKAA